MSKPAGSDRDGLVSLPSIPAKRYFTIGEVSDLCAVKPHVLRYWEQEFTQLKPIKRRGNRRYYQHHEVLLIRRIRELLYEQGFTINGARNRLDGMGGSGVSRRRNNRTALAASDEGTMPSLVEADADADGGANEERPRLLIEIRSELETIRTLLSAAAAAPGNDDSVEN
jgi:DNA-binding transcriptional MerR regulator